MIISNGENITFHCPVKGDQYIWDLPSLSSSFQRNEYTNLRSRSTRSESNTEFFLSNVSYAYVGLFTCTTVKNYPCHKIKQRTYLYVRDEKILSVVNNQLFSTDLVVTQNEDLTIPCRPTTPDIHVDLFIGASTDKVTQIFLNIPVNENGGMYQYDPHKGFQTNDTMIPGVKIYRCKFTTNLREEVLTSRIIIKPTKISVPKPILEDVIGQNLIGARLIVGCTVKTDNDLSVEWITPQPNSDKRIQIFTSRSNTTTWWFSVNKIKLTDAGRYYCKVNYKADDFNIEEIDISVYDGNKNFINLVRDEDNSVVDLWSVENGTSVLWRVKFNGYPKPKLFWKRNEEFLKPSSKYVIHFSSSEALLKIKNVSHEDFGNYTLIAKNGYFTKLHDITLNMTSKPSTHMEVINLDEGLVKCMAVAYPNPIIYWSFKPCYDDFCFFHPMKEVRSEENGLQLTSYVNVNASWSGFLKCHANNSIGEDIFIQEVANIKGDFNIFGDNVTIFSDGSRIFDVKHNESITITCRVSVHNYSDEIKWFHKEKPVREHFLFSPNVKLQTRNTIYSNRLSLTLHNITKNDEGSYRCEVYAKNDIPHSKSIRIVVGDEMLSPNITYTNLNKQIEVFLHDNFRFDCYVDGFPTPSVVWLKNNNTLQPSERIEIINYDQTLILKNVTKEDKGTYTCKASNEVGSDLKVVDLDLTSKPLDYYWFIIAALILLLIASSVFTIIKTRNEKKLQKELTWVGLENFEEGAVDKLNPELGIGDQVDVLPYDRKWEIPIENLKLGKQLGSGAFGVVMKGELIDKINDKNTITVAVKTVNKSGNFSCLKALASELKIMAHLGQHLNIVNLLGACTKNVSKRELYVVVEYCRFGNLQHYLVRHKANFISQVSEMGQFDDSIAQNILKNRFIAPKNKSKPKCLQPERYVTMPFEQNINTSPENKLNSSSGTEDLTSDVAEEEPTDHYIGDYQNDVTHICTKDLIIWAFQVARGMEYLSSRKILHGDLAARNILLSEENVVKICDFGLAKNMYYNDIYKKTDQGPLPVKWMAIESIVYKIFSIQSDVWSFGVVLWEFFSLGKTPYPSMRVDEAFFNKLTEGYRMECPQFAPKEMYRAMLDCWQADPLMRPSFTELAERIGVLLEEPVKNYYVDMNNFYLMMNQQAHNNGNQDYLAMMRSPNFENILAPRQHYVNELPLDDGGSGYLSMEANTNILKQNQGDIGDTINSLNGSEHTLKESKYDLTVCNDSNSVASFSNPAYTYDPMEAHVSDANNIT